MQILGPDATREALPWAVVMSALSDALIERAEEEGYARSRIPTRAGELLIMPATGARYFGVKLASIATDPTIATRVQGQYVLFSQATMEPVALIDAIELTLRRTAGLSALAISTGGGARGHVHVYGAGPQAIAHVAALDALGLVSSAWFTSRSAESAARAASAVSALGIPVHELPLRAAATIICATTAADPLFSLDELGPAVRIAAVGSHDVDRREVPTDVVVDAYTVVDGRDAARREAGDIVLAEHETGRTVIDATLGELVRGEVGMPPPGRVLFKSVGEAWQDLAVAGAALAAGGEAAI